MTTLPRRTEDHLVQQAVEAALEAAPDVDPSDIGVAVQAAISWVGEAEDSVDAEIWRGTVTLTGHLRWRFQQRALTRAVESVSGVLRVDDRTRVTLEA